MTANMKPAKKNRARAAADASPALAAVKERDSPGTDERPIMGIRDKKKKLKLDQIKAAADTLFSRQGYERTTLRQIAAAAGVGFGTLFSYAKDKRDLLFLVYADELDGAWRRGFEGVDPKDPLVDQLISVLFESYSLYAQNPPLARALLHEFNYLDPVDGSRTKFRPKEWMVDLLAAMIGDAQKNRQIDPALPAQSLAWLVFFTTMGAVRHWLASPEPIVADGIAILRALLMLQFSGMHRPAGK